MNLAVRSKRQSKKGLRKNIAFDITIYLWQMTGDSGFAFGPRFCGICNAGITVRFSHFRNPLEKGSKTKAASIYDKKANN